jgi:DNA-binding NarL/FixJ family response regulator
MPVNETIETTSRVGCVFLRVGFRRFDFQAIEVVDVILADAPPSEQLTDWQVQHQQIAWVLVLDGADKEASLDVLSTGALAVLPRTANRREIVTAIRAVTNGLVVFQRQLLAALLNAESLSGEQLNTSNDGSAQLTPGELEVLTAMADGTTNKAIARRMGFPSTPSNFTSLRFSKNSTLTLGQKP